MPPTMHHEPRHYSVLASQRPGWVRTRVWTQPHGRSDVAGRWSERLPGNGFHQGWAHGRGWTTWSGKPKPGRPSRKTHMVPGRDEATLLYPTRSTPQRGRDLSGDRSLIARESSGRRGKPHPIPRPLRRRHRSQMAALPAHPANPTQDTLSSTPRSPGSADSSPCLNPYPFGHRAVRRTTSPRPVLMIARNVLQVLGLAASTPRGMLHDRCHSRPPWLTLVIGSPARVRGLTMLGAVNQASRRPGLDGFTAAPPAPGRPSPKAAHTCRTDIRPPRTGLQPDPTPARCPVPG